MSINMDYEWCKIIEFALQILIKLKADYADCYD